MLGILRVWYTDENAIVRQKVRASMLTRLASLLAEVAGHGVREGVFTTDYPDETAEALFSLTQGLVDAPAELLLSFAPQGGDLGKIERTPGAPVEALA